MSPPRISYYSGILNKPSLLTTEKNINEKNPDHKITTTQPTI
jgi:hypothetical protein